MRKTRQEAAQNNIRKRKLLWFFPKPFLTTPHHPPSPPGPVDPACENSGYTLALLSEAHIYPESILFWGLVLTLLLKVTTNVEK